MKSPSSFDRTLFYDSSPATDQFFEERASRLFETEDDRSCLQLHIQPLPLGRELDQLVYDFPPRTKVRKGSMSDSDCDSPSISPLPVDQSRFLRGDPPQYIGLPGLTLQNVSDASKLQEIAMVKSFSEKQYLCSY